MPARRAAAALLPPLLILAAALWLNGHIAVDPSSLRASRGMFGPGFWPRLMLGGVAFCAAGWLLRSAISVLRSRPAGRAPDSTSYDAVRATVGVVLALAYGIAVPFVGFAFSTLAFVVAWMLLGGYRRPIGVALVALPGIACVLWFFAGVAKMPLDLGKGAFETATVALYRALGIF